MLDPTRVSLGGKGQLREQICPHTKDLQHVTHSLSGPGFPWGLPLNKELDHLGSKE